jgi:hypothetical protein
LNVNYGRERVVAEFTFRPHQNECLSAFIFVVVRVKEGRGQGQALPLHCFPAIDLFWRLTPVAPMHWNT